MDLFAVVSGYCSRLAILSSTSCALASPSSATCFSTPNSARLSAPFGLASTGLTEPGKGAGGHSLGLANQNWQFRVGRLDWEVGRGDPGAGLVSSGRGTAGG